MSSGPGSPARMWEPSDTCTTMRGWPSAASSVPSIVRIAGCVADAVRACGLDGGVRGLVCAWMTRSVVDATHVSEIVPAILSHLDISRFTLTGYAVRPGLLRHRQ